MKTNKNQIIKKIFKSLFTLEHFEHLDPVLELISEHFLQVLSSILDQLCSLRSLIVKFVQTFGIIEFEPFFSVRTIGILLELFK